MNPAYLGGLVVGATIGALIIGGLLGWAIHKATRLDYSIADGIGVLLLPLGIALGSGANRLDPLSTWLVYGRRAHRLLHPATIAPLDEGWSSQGGIGVARQPPRSTM